jgi:hypothetical protein
MTTGQTPTGRTCAGCTMCCKLLVIPELAKPAMQWCPNCDVGVGCKIYQDRPASCGAFQCGFLTSPQLDERWRPSSCKIVVVIDDPARRIFVHAEQSSAWRKEPFFSRIKHWAKEMWPNQVLVWQGNEVVAVLPNKEVNLGVIGEDQRIHTKETYSASGVDYEAWVVTKT